MQDAVNMDSIALDDGASAHLASDDDDPQALSSGAPALRPPFGSLGSSSNSENSRTPAFKVAVRYVLPGGLSVVPRRCGPRGPPS